MPRPQNLRIRTLDHTTREQLVGNVIDAAIHPGAGERVARWHADHGAGHATEASFSFAVVGTTLMFLHPCPDGVCLPFAEFPDGRVVVYTDPLHAEDSFYPDDQPTCEVTTASVIPSTRR